MEIAKIYLESRAEHILEEMRNNENIQHIAKMCCDYNHVYKFMEHHCELMAMEKVRAGHPTTVAGSMVSMM